MYTVPPRRAPNDSADDTLTTPVRPLSPPVPVITVTNGVDPRAQRDPSTLDDASPYFATSSESPRTP